MQQHRGPRKLQKTLRTPVRPTPVPCPIQTACQGCAYVNQDYEKTTQAKFSRDLERLRHDELLADAHVVAVHRSPRPLAYRTTAKLAVRPSTDAMVGRFAIGLFQPGTHKLTDIRACAVHVPVIEDFLRILRDLLEASALVPWDEAKNEGDLRYISVKTSHLTEQLMVTFVVNHDGCKDALKALVKDARVRGAKVVSAHMNLNWGVNNRIFGREVTLLHGQARLRAPLCGLNLEVSPTAFSQINPWQAANIYRRVEQLAGKPFGSSIAWDLYCGSGHIGLILARSGFSVLGCEENPNAVEDARLNRRLNEMTDDQIRFIEGCVEDSLAKLAEGEKPSLIVVNPSRRGIDPVARGFIVDQLRASPSTRMIYVSCSIESFARDLKDMTSQGLRLRQVEAFDMFAQTDQLEWLALLTSN